MMDQISFNQALFDACPIGMLAVDRDIRIRWLNPALEKMLNLSGHDLIGKDKQSLPDDLHALFDETDVLHLSLNGDGERWLQRIVQEVTDGADNRLRLHFYQDISSQILAQQENQHLRRQVEELTITDELTGLANQRAVLQALAVQVTRSRRYGNPLTLGVVRISHPHNLQVSLADTTILAFSHFLRERLRWADTIGRYAPQLFLLVMPETRQEDAHQLLEQIVQECQQGALTEISDTPIPQVEISAKAWEKGDDPQQLLQRTLQGLGH